MSNLNDARIQHDCATTGGGSGSGLSNRGHALEEAWAAAENAKAIKALKEKDACCKADANKDTCCKKAGNKSCSGKCACSKS